LKGECQAMNNIRRFLTLNTIRKKMLLYSLLLTLFTIITSFYTINNAGHIIQNFDYMFVNNVHLTQLSNNIHNIDNELLDFLTTLNSDSLDLYMKNSNDLRDETKAMSRLSYDNNQLMLNDISNMIDEYLNQADFAIEAKRGRDINECNDRYNKAKEISSSIDYYIKQLNFNQFNVSTQKYFFMSGRIKTLQVLNIVIIALNLLFNMELIFWFTSKMSIPIVNLAKSAGEISLGNFDTDNVEVNTKDEIKVMADAFNKMKGNIKNHIEDLKTQAEIETKLMDEKVQNLRMKSLLKSAEIQALQSQINPHFLFNTLNAGVQLAMMEDAEKTGIFLEKMSNLFRYNLRKIDKPVTLMEELNNLYTYIYILEVRFGDLIKFKFDIANDLEEDANNLYMPAMIIQPLIENACIHGIGDMEEGGEVTLRARKLEGFVELIVEDNGLGMSETTLQDIMNLYKDKPLESKKSKVGHTTGIGLDNVHRRLNVFYEREDILTIESEPSRGTRIRLILPLIMGGQEDV
jgi:two-component system sensor histidine kinase YesM